MPVVRKTGSVADFEKIIEVYKIQNPVKYELKKEDFAKRLEALKKAEVVESKLEGKKK